MTAGLPSPDRTAALRGLRSWGRRFPVARLTEPQAFRLGVALLMALVSLASAYVTHVATERGAQAAALDGTASQQSAEEQQADQQIDAIIAQDQRLTARLDEYVQVFRQGRDHGAPLREADPARAAEYDLMAQDGLEHVRHLLPFYRAALPNLGGDSATYDADEARGALRSLDWRLFRASSALTRADAGTVRASATSTVLVVVMLVASLFLLTLAHLAGGRRGLTLAGLGIVSAIGSLLWFTAVALDAALPLLLAATVALAIAVLVGRTGQWRRWVLGLEKVDAVPDIVSVPTRPGSVAVTGPDAPRHTRLTQFVAFAIAGITLGGACVGYLHGASAGEADKAAWDARDIGVQAIGALRAAEESTTVGVETYQLALTQRVKGWNAAQHASYAASVSDDALASHLLEEASRWETIAALTEERSGAGADLGSTGVSDELVLRRLRARVWEPAARLAALQDAANAASRDWGERAAIYISVLAWLAVAAYLLGLSLVFREDRVRIILAGVATLMIVASAVRTATVWTLPGAPSAEQAERAAEAYAAGYLALERNEPTIAEPHFSRAIELRPDFGIARRERAQAILLSGSAQGSGIRSVFTPAAVDLVIDDLTAARDRGAESAGVMLNLGAMMFHRAIQTDDPAAMRASVDLSRRGLELGAAFGSTYGRPHLFEVIGRANLGLALLGTGQIGEAERAYREMTAATRQLPTYLHPQIVGAALTTIEILGKAPQPTAVSVLSEMKELVVAETYAVAADAPARITSATAEVFSSVLQWRATITDLDAARDTLVIQWYRHDPTFDRWYALPLVSGPVKLDAEALGGQFHRDADDSYWGNSSGLLRDIPPTCAPPGRFRLELYLNGTLADTKEVESSPESYSPHLARDVGFAMCRPTDWVPTAVDPGFTSGVADPDGSRGVVVFRLHQPLTPDGPDSRVTALDRLLGQDVAGLPEDLGAGTPLDPLTQPTIFGRNDAVWRLHEYPGGVAKTAATMTAFGFGTVLVTCLYGPEDWIDSPVAQALVLSLIEH